MNYARILGDTMQLEEYKSRFANHVKDLQDQITAEMHKIDGELSLNEDCWDRKDHNGDEGGGGITRAFEGEVFENAGVNTSEIYGAVNPDFATKLKGDGNEIWATGISLILHPTNPRVPTVHANFRMIQQGDFYWFGGGADLTPFYPHEDDFHYFHKTLREACAPFDCYEWMKKECDQYFVNHHRKGEMRGIGGIFFDHFNTGNLDNDFNMVVDLSNSFIKSYFPIVQKRFQETFDKTDEEFQLFRRGRYVEFNLIHDRGTHFGLKTNGRTDSILISLPKRCEFTYRYEPKPGTPHSKMMEYYYPQEWGN